MLRESSRGLRFYRCRLGVRGGQQPALLARAFSGGAFIYGVEVGVQLDIRSSTAAGAEMWRERSRDRAVEDIYQHWPYILLHSNSRLGYTAHANSPADLRLDQEADNWIQLRYNLSSVMRTDDTFILCRIDHAPYAVRHALLTCTACCQPVRLLTGTRLRLGPPSDYRIIH